MQIQKHTIIRVDFHGLDILKCLILFRFDVFSNNKIQFFQLSSLGNWGTPNVKYLLICKKKKKKQRHYFADKSLSSQSYGFSIRYVWMWELSYKESWMPKNWCFWTVVLKKPLESHLDCEEIQPVHPKGDQSWIFIGRTDAEASASILGPPDVKSWLIWKDPDAGKDWRQEDEMGGWQLQLDEHESEQALGVGDGQGCWPVAVYGVTELDTTEQLNWTESTPG